MCVRLAPPASQSRHAATLDQFRSMLRWGQFSKATLIKGLEFVGRSSVGWAG